ncbi:MAG: protein translocase subunit SecD, partial [Pirellulales bacterium]|nr:protein translocase subunit SecD [Pirellulales bacterium]
MRLAEPRRISDKEATIMQDWVVNLGIALALLIVPPALGYYLARTLRMTEYGWKISLALFTLALAVVVPLRGWPPQFGPDLAGGFNLVYEVDREQLKEKTGADNAKNPDASDDEAGNVDMDKLISAISMRINPDGLKEIVIRQYGEGKVEIIIPRADAEELQRVKNKISNIGTLEFRILANRRDHERLQEEALRLPLDVREVRSGTGTVQARWVPLRHPEDAAVYAANPNFATRVNRRQQTEILVAIDPYSVTGRFLTSARPGVNDRAQPAVHFTFNTEGAYYFHRLTSDNLPDQVGNFQRQLGIILDGQLFSAPNIEEAISDQGQISGGSMDDKAVEDLCAVLNAGALPTALRKEPISSLFTGPTIGADTVQKGWVAMSISLLAVFLLVSVYYRFSGLVATFTLVLNLLLVVAAMIMLNAALTLAGIAGLVLGVGMSVDANVLIFERIREEKDRGASLRMAIRNGFDRATTTIIDSNLTTLISAVVLYVIGTDQIKGFAVALIIGLVMNLYTAVFVARIIFDVCERQRWISQLSMGRLLDKTNVDFMGMARWALAGSVAIIAIGLAAVAYRGSNMLDIDFTGGTSVQIEFREPQRIDELRTAVAKVEDKLPDAVVTNLSLEDEGSADKFFVINTSQLDVDQVETTLKELFAGKLQTNELSLDGAVAMVEAPPAPAGEAAQPESTPPATPLTTPAPATPETPAAPVESSTA